MGILLRLTTNEHSSTKKKKTNLKQKLIFNKHSQIRKNLNVTMVLEDYTRGPQVKIAFIIDRKETM